MIYLFYILYYIILGLHNILFNHTYYTIYCAYIFTILCLYCAYILFLYYSLLSITTYLILFCCLFLIGILSMNTIIFLFIQRIFMLYFCVINLNISFTANTNLYKLYIYIIYLILRIKISYFNPKYLRAKNLPLASIFPSFLLKKTVLFSAHLASIHCITESSHFNLSYP